MKKQALLIGINEYQILPELKYARQDAEAIEQALKQNYCFSDDEVMLLTDAKPGLFKPVNRLIIRSHLEKLANQELDLFIFGFWGHGFFKNGERYLCPLDVMSDAVEELGFSFTELQQLLSKIKAKNTCMILDCCQKTHDRGGADTMTAADQKNMENAARDIVLQRKEQIPEFQSNVAILNSCKEGQSAYEWDKRGHGVFTAHLIDAMNRRLDSVAKIVGYISSAVEKTAMELGRVQTPFYKLEGDIPLPVNTESAPLVTGNVFVSYRHCNADLVAPIEDELKSRGISYFIDRVGVNYGMEYSKAISLAVKGCKVLLLIWTSDANDSADMVREVKMALDLNKTVIPYKIGLFNPVEHDALYFQLSPLSRFEAAAQTPDSIREIVNRIELALSGKDLPIMDSKSGIGSSFSSHKISAFLLDKAKQIEVEALDAIEKEDYKSAIQKLEFILSLDPNSEDAKRLLKLCQAALLSGGALDKPVPETKAGERKTFVVNGVEFAFRWCPAGSFIMGSPVTETGRWNDEIQHKVTLSSGFWMLETQVTQRQWKAVMGVNFSHFKGDDLPVEKVSWNDCQKFCKKCTELGLPVELPTEAQWEYACRAGSATAFSWGNELNGDKANCNGNYPCGTMDAGKYLEMTSPVGSYSPNDWGLLDMHGNVWEWCQDWKGDYPGESVTDPTGPSTGACRVNRGGGWYSDAGKCRAAYRGGGYPGVRNYATGLRLVKSNDK